MLYRNFDCMRIKDLCLQIIRPKVKNTLFFSVKLKCLLTRTNNENEKNEPLKLNFILFSTEFSLTDYSTNRSANLSKLGIQSEKKIPVFFLLV
jgi:hypothetical protein